MPSLLHRVAAIRDGNREARAEKDLCMLPQRIEGCGFHIRRHSTQHSVDQRRFIGIKSLTIDLRQALKLKLHSSSNWRPNTS